MSTTTGRILLLGSGLCAPAFVDYMLQKGIHLIVATRTIEKAQSLLRGHPNGKAVALDIEKEGAFDLLDELVQEVDLIASLLPYVYHVKAARVALRHKKHFCTSSYISDEMQGLDEEAKAAGVILINECGVDPGLDHMSAQKIIDEVHRKGGQILEFYSICGGLPSPQHNNNPLGYKVSWSPRGVLLASRNNSTFLENGEVQSIPGIDLYAEGVYRREFIETVGDLEWYFNRDSVKYRDIYNIPEVQTIIRGTYRYPGWCRMMRKLALSGFTSIDPIEGGLHGKTYFQFTASVLGLEGDVNQDTIRPAAAGKLEVDVSDDIIHRLEWLGLFSEQTIKEGINTPLDAVCFLFEEKMQYAHGEKDMICMKHTFEVEYPSSGRREQITSTLINFGLQPDGFTSMSRTVALPLAIVSRAIVDGRVKLTGIQRPVVPSLYELILNEMEELDVKFEERVSPVHILLRHEVKELEFRAALSPEGVHSLVQAGIRVSVEKSPTRCFPDSEYEKAGAQLIPTGSWQKAPPSTIILGLKELPEDCRLNHRHVYFAHCYKGQEGSASLLRRFREDKGVLWDLEFLVDERGRRVAAFGHPAGYVGMALGLLDWADKQMGSTLTALQKPWMSNKALISDVKKRLQECYSSSSSRQPTVYVLGALGRAGSGAVEFAESVGITPIKWDLEETKKGGPFPELLEGDILVNCIYLSSKIPPFLTAEMLAASPQKKLSVVVDVSCDPNNTNNPLPFYHQCTTMSSPVLKVPENVDVIAIDHLPSLLPEASSVMFSKDLVPSLVALCNPQSPEHAVWSRAQKLFSEKLSEHKM